MEKKELVVHGRKVSIMDIRKDLLAKHECMGLMRDHDMTLGEYSMQRKEIVKELKAMDEYQEDNDCRLEDGELPGRLYACHNTRMLLLGHDHAEVLGHSYLMEVVYDMALFWTDEEYAKKHGHKLSSRKRSKRHLFASWPCPGPQKRSSCGRFQTGHRTSTAAESLYLELPANRYRMN